MLCQARYCARRVVSERLAHSRDTDPPKDEGSCGLVIDFGVDVLLDRRAPRKSQCRRPPMDRDHPDRASGGNVRIVGNSL